MGKEFAFKLSMLGKGFGHDFVDFEIILVFDLNNVDGVLSPLCRSGTQVAISAGNVLLKDVDEEYVRVGCLPDSIWQHPTRAYPVCRPSWGALLVTLRPLDCAQI